MGASASPKPAGRATPRAAEEASRPFGDHQARKLRTIDMFAGIGGFSLGLHRTGGFETVAFAETDPYASRVLEKRFPGVPNVGNVETAEYPDADFITAGFPCQDISFAGDGAGLAGARSGLWREVVRAICVVRPRGALLENVAALLSRGMHTVLGDLAEVGHDAEWHCIPASAVGAPHRRDRVWIATHPRGEQHEGDRAPLSGTLAAELSRADSDADNGRQQIRREQDGGAHKPCIAAPFGDYTDGLRSPVADTPCELLDGSGETRARRRAELANSGWWLVEPDLGRVAHGIPKRVDRLRCLGNAVVPQIPELIGRAILQAEGR